MRICCLTAHPDDLEVGAAGTLLKYQSQGAVVDSVILVKPSAEVRHNRSQEIVIDESSNSYELSGFNIHVFDTPLFDNGRPNLTCDTNTITEVSRLVSDHSYDLVLLPNPTDWHQDHRCTYEIGMSIFARCAKEIWTMDTWPYCTRSHHGNIKVDISQQWYKKLSLIKCYHSYITDQDLIDIGKINQYWGVCMGTEHAESFNLATKNVR
jgi:N-acetylglucosamine malate deacetylase 1